MTTLLIANRGEIAVRITRTAHRLGMTVVAVHGTDDRDSTHVRAADLAVDLGSGGPGAYLDIEAIIAAAHSTNSTMIHPGYGFLSEKSEFAERCEQEDLIFVGPTVDTLRLFGDKSATRAFATAAGVPVLAATSGSTTLDAASEFAATRHGGPVIVKALSGGGGRGMRVVEDPSHRGDLESAINRCRSEAELGFGSADIYVEQFLPRARHIEVQVIGDGGATPIHLFDRDCTLQRRHQKMIEFAPAPGLAPEIRAAIRRDALILAASSHLRGLATMEFLVDAVNPERYYFIETNPRLQVEHPVTEQITGLDLVELQLAVAGGSDLTDIDGLATLPTEPRGSAAEARITATALSPSGQSITGLEFPEDPGVRIESHLELGSEVPAAFDPLLAKVIVHCPGGTYLDVVDALADALAGTTLAGVHTDIELLIRVLGSDEVRTLSASTRTVDRFLAEERNRTESPDPPPPRRGDRVTVHSRGAGTVVAVLATRGQSVTKGDPLVVVEAMKMETENCAPTDGVVDEVCVRVGDVIDTDAAAMVLISSVETDITEPVAVVNTPDLDRSDIRHNETRHAQTLDAARPQAVAKRHARGKRTARENIADLLDENSFHENGALTIAAQRSRRTIDDLEANTPADGVVTGFGTVDGVPVAVLAYDYSVLAGTQGLQGHKKAERLFTLAARRRAPVVIFAEGGGGRPGDTDNLAKATGMDLATFVALGRLNGQVPTVAIASGRCFAGNAALVGMCDVVIATSDTNLGLGGPAMIEGGGLGIVRSEEIGPLQTQYANGVVDVAVTDEAEATEAARRHLSYFTHPVIDRRSCSDQAQLRTVIPERRTRTFDIRTVVATVSDTDSVFELRAGFGLGMVTALARIEGRAVGMVANNGAHRGGAIGADEADKAARFLQLCDAHQVPVVTLCDTPGFMVGPDSERTATVRHVARLFVLAPNLRVPLCTVIIRKSYGLGGQAMAGGSFRVPDAIVAWPTAELGAMGPEGAVQLGFRRELEQIDDPAEHARVYQGYLDDYERQGKPANAASVFEIDDVIDPSETRSWISTTFAGHDRSDTQPTRVRIDTW